MQPPAKTDPFPRMVRKLPTGRSGKARIEHFTVGSHEALISELKSLHPETLWDARLAQGRFARLWVGEHMMMADTAPERISCLEVVKQARGRVFIAGLGLGMILWPIASKPEVDSITVVERYPEVVRLVGPHVPARVKIVTADVFRYRPRRRFDVIWHDIWPLIGIANLFDMHRLHQRYRRWLAPGGWMESWQREVCEKQARKAVPGLVEALAKDDARFRRLRLPRELARSLGCHE